ncbi:hypothetical protein [Helicobacter pylori]|uniref:hypothetical protein n=1 Tax=Helicobacter pylori TaxID=210 RepID=UPI003F908F8A
MKEKLGFELTGIFYCEKALDLENVDELVKSILLLDNNLKSHVSEGKLLPNNNLKCYISEGSYIIDLHLIDD